VAKLVAKDYNTTIAGTDFSTSLAAITLDIEAEEVETTAFGSDWRQRVSGLKNGSVSFDFHQDFAAGAVDETLWSNLGGTVEVVIKPTSGTVSADNPSYTFNALITQVTPFANSIGDLATVSVEFPIDGEVTRGTA